MTYRRLLLLIPVVCAGLVGAACSRSNSGVVPVPTAALVDNQRKEERFLCFVDSVEVADIKEAGVGPEDIKQINVLSPSETTDLVSTYGPKAKNGVIFVTTKKGKPHTVR